MTAAKNYLACFWGAAAFYSLCYGIIYRSANALLLFAALAPLLAVFLWWMADRAALERRIKRLEARSDIADERRVITQTDLTEFEHELEEVKTRVTSAENIKAQSEIRELIPGRIYGKQKL
jgi:membrane protein implicated in regulation of membrane protease activity